MDKRPLLNKEISIKDFREFYWLKEELLTFCRAEGLRTQGSKFELSERIIHYLDTGQKEEAEESNSAKPRSDFDWQNQSLSLETEITDNYKNTENVRIFFRDQIGPQFKFNVHFMNWMKSNSGKTLKDAISEWRRINSSKKASKKEKDIAPQFEYNRYLRDFLKANPHSSRDLGIKLWNIKKTLRGDNKYKKEDLRLLDGK